jgi:hypothetical protein
MSNFKKMKLVDLDEQKGLQRNVFRTEKYTTSKHLRRISGLDKQMNEILNSKLDEITKVKLYSQALRKFLTFKKKHEEDEEVAKRLAFQNINIPKIVTLKAPKVKKTPKKKRRIIIPKAPKKTKRYRRITPPSSPIIFQSLSPTVSPKSSRSVSPKASSIVSPKTSSAGPSRINYQTISEWRKERVTKPKKRKSGRSRTPEIDSSEEFIDAETGEDTATEQKGDAWIIY